METGRFDSDVLVIGGGPGGCAAAIASAMMSLRVRLLERNAGSTERPGETLHPGVESLLAQLGIMDEFAAVVGSRHAGIRIRWGKTSRFEAYGGDQQGPWRGFQVWRKDFDALLRKRACDLGVDVIQPCSARDVLLENGSVRGVVTSSGALRAPVVVDATGRSHWLAKRLSIEQRVYSPNLVARYGYANGELPSLDGDPLLTGDSSGWLWTAKVRPGLYHWTRVALDGTRIPNAWRPNEFRHLVPNGATRGADVTWKLAQTVAQPGWFMVGDSAALLDPTSGQGVLKAMLSGIMAAKLAYGVVTGAAPADEVAGIYRDWLSGWFVNSVGFMAQFYNTLGAAGFEARKVMITSRH